MKTLTRRAAAFAAAASLSLTCLTAHAEGQLRITQQFGVPYLLLNVAQELKLIEKHGKSAGVEIKPEFITLSGGVVVNDALLSSNVEIAGAGMGPLFTLWDRTRGRQNVKGVVSLGNFPYYLISTNPKVKTIADLTEQDRIALPAVGVSMQARYLQLAAAKLWGDKEYARLDRFTVTLPLPDATVALIKGGTEINAHLGVPPFQDQELAANPKAHVVLKSYDTLGGPSTATALYATEKFRTENPKTYKAFVDALTEAADFASKNPEQAADLYLKASGDKIDRALLIKVLKSPEVQFKTTPQNTLTLGRFMHRVGAIKNDPQSVKDYFFDDFNGTGS